MRQFDLTSAIPASVGSTWEVVSDISGRPRWSVLFPQANGRLVEGKVLVLAKRDASGEAKPFSPTVVSVDPPTRFVLEAGFGPRTRFPWCTLSSSSPSTPQPGRCVRRGRPTLLDMTGGMRYARGCRGSRYSARDWHPGWLPPNKRIKLTRQRVAARMSRGARSLSAVRWAQQHDWGFA
jgi:hypothetical protein